MIEVELPDGRVVEFPDGTDQKTMRDALNRLAMRERIAAAKSGGLSISPERAAAQSAIDLPVEQDLRDPGAVRAALAGASQGATLGFGDEILGGISAGAGAMGDALSLNFSGMGDRMAQTYADTRDAARDEYNNAKFARPKTTMAGEVAGGAVSLAAPGGAIVKSGTGLAARAGLGAASGAASGAVYGFGSGEGGFANRAEEAAKTAAFGALGGAAAPVVISGLGAAKNAVVNPLLNMLNIPSEQRTSAAILKLLRRSGMSVDDADAAIRAAATDGQDVFRLVDAIGAPGQRFLSGIARQPGDTARKEITDFLMERQGGQGDRLTRFMAEALDAKDTAAAREASMVAARNATANSAYDAARKGASAVDVRGAISVIDDRLGPMSGMGVAGDGIDKRLAGFRDRLAAPAANLPKGTTAVELSDFNRVLGVKQDLGDAIGEAVRAGRGNEARELMKLQSELDAALEAASPDYRAANDGFAKASADIRAIDSGKAAASGRVRAEDTAANFAGLSPEGKSAFRVGYSDPLIAKIDAAAMPANKARPLTSGKTAKDLETLAVDADLAKRRLARENTMFETGSVALGGSRTADNMADIADVQGASNSVIGNLLFGNWGAAGRQIADKAVAASTGASPATRELIARALLSSDPRAAVAPAIRKAKQLEGPRQAIEAIIRSGAIIVPQ